MYKFDQTTLNKTMPNQTMYDKIRNASSNVFKPDKPISDFIYGTTTIPTKDDDKYASPSTIEPFDSFTNLTYLPIEQNS